MLTLGEQLVLLALDADKGTLRGAQALQYGLNAAGLAELLERGLITLRRPDGGFGVTPVEGAEAAASALDDRLLKAVWKQLQYTSEGRRHPDLCVRTWHEPSLHAHLDALRKRGAVGWDKAKQPKARYGRFRLLDPEAAASARARVDRVRTGDEPDARDQHLAGIAAALGYGKVLYPGVRGRSKRAALAAAVEKQRFAVIIRRAVPAPADQEFTFDSSRDSQMALNLVRAVTFDGHHAGFDGGLGGFGGLHH